MVALISILTFILLARAFRSLVLRSTSNCRS
jgi:hypothetical protein